MEQEFNEYRAHIRKEFADELGRYYKDFADEPIICTCGTTVGEHSPRCAVGAYQNATKTAQLLAED
jgi:hypothetical protein